MWFWVLGAGLWRLRAGAGFWVLGAGFVWARVWRLGFIFWTSEAKLGRKWRFCKGLAGWESQLGCVGGGVQRVIFLRLAAGWFWVDRMAAGDRWVCGVYGVG